MTILENNWVMMEKLLIPCAAAVMCASVSCDIRICPSGIAIRELFVGH